MNIKNILSICFSFVCLFLNFPWHQRTTGEFFERCQLFNPFALANLQDQLSEKNTRYSIMNSTRPNDSSSQLFFRNSLCISLLEAIVFFLADFTKSLPTILRKVGRNTLNERAMNELDT